MPQLAARPRSTRTKPTRPTRRGAPRRTGTSPRTFDPAMYRPRLERLSAAVRTEGVSHLLVSNPLDVGYLTGFLGGDSYLLLPVGSQGSKPVLLSDFRYVEELEPYKALCDLFIRQGTMVQAVIERVSDSSVRRCGVQAEQMTLAERDAIVRGAGDGKLVPLSGAVSRLRAIKDEHEVGLITKAIRIQEKALKTILPGIKPGQTELDVSAALEGEMKRLGSVTPGFTSIVAARSNGSLPHYRPGLVKLAKNQPLLIDWGGKYEGYTGDMTRTFTLGAWPVKIREIYEVVLDAHRLAAEALGPGKVNTDIDAIARNHIAKHGYGEFFGHGLGHGIGLNVHENPRVDFRGPKEELRPGHVVTNEPGIYLPGVGGVRLENDYLITETGARNLCTLPMDLKWATLG